MAQTIRFHPRCPFRKDAGELEYAPAMIAAFRNVAAVLGRIIADYREHHDLKEVERDVLADPHLIVAIHRTRLTPDGRKISRGMLGPAKGAAILLSPPTGIIEELAATISEGIESGLSAMRRGFRGVIALGSTSGIRGFAPHPFIPHLTIAGENDDASRKAVAACVETWTRPARVSASSAQSRGTTLTTSTRGRRRD